MRKRIYKANRLGNGELYTVLVGLAGLIVITAREINGEGMLNSCVCELDGEVYNLTTLGNDGVNPAPRYTLSFLSTREDYMYFFNPCHPFNWPPIRNKQQRDRDILQRSFSSSKELQSFGSTFKTDPPLCIKASLCQRDLKGSLQSLYKIVTSQETKQGKLRCVKNKTAGIQWVYKGYGSLFEKGGLVLTLICNEHRDEAKVTAQYDVDRRKGDPWKYVSVEHKCCCPNKCGYVKPQPPQPTSKENLVAEILGFGGGFLVLLIIVILVCCLQRYLYKKQPAIRPDLQGNKDYGTFTVNPEYLTKIIPYKEIQIDENNKIGEGAFGIVYKARWRNSDVAVKRIKEHVVDEDIDPFIRESLWMSNLPHHNIVQFYGICVLQPNLCIITEFMEGGSVADVIHGKRKRILSWKERIKWAEDAAKGMTYLHCHQPPIIHRDLKSDNLLVDENGLVKIADFGAMKLLQPLITRHEASTSTERSNTPKSGIGETSWAGTLRWSAPEVIPHNGQKKIIIQYTPSSDVYSFAMTVWELISNKRPYCHLDWDYEVMTAIQNGERPDFPDSCPQNVRDFIEKCWDGNPGIRPSFQDILKSLENLKVHFDCDQKPAVTWPPLSSFQHKQAMIQAI